MKRFLMTTTAAAVALALFVAAQTRADGHYGYGIGPLLQQLQPPRRVRPPR